MVRFSEAIEDALDRTGELYPLVAVPFLSTFARVDNVRRVLDSGPRGFELHFAFPAPIVDLWSFLDASPTGAGLHVSPLVYLLPVFVLVQSALASGYLGSVHEALQGRQYGFTRNVRRYVRPFVVWYSLVVLSTILAALMALAWGGPAVVPVVVLGFGLGFLFYATPYLFVTNDLGVIESLSLNVELALNRREYLRFGLAYFLLTGAISVLGAVIVDGTLLGIVLAAVALAPVGLILNVATMRFVDDLANGTEGLGANEASPAGR